MVPALVYTQVSIGKENPAQEFRRLTMKVDLGILCFSSTDWEGVWGSRQQIMLRFAHRGYPVLFIEQPAGLEHLARYPELRRRKMRRWQEGLQQIVENLWIASLPPLLPGRYYAAGINSINQYLTTTWTRRILSRKSSFTPAILWVYNPEQGPLVSRFRERLSIYHCIDEFTAGQTGRKRRTISSLEADLLRRVDLVFANSQPTYEIKLRLNPNTIRVPSGADTGHFIQALDPAYPEHPSLSDIPRPRIGYTGNINERLDYSLLEYLAAQRPEWSFVFIGEPFPWTMDAPPLRHLRQRKNCFFPGKFPFSDMPALLKGLDVCLLPYSTGETASYRIPLKLYEYLAAGRPVVSVEHAEAIELSPWVYTAGTPESFLVKIVEALREDTAERQRQRAAMAQEHSWDRRVDQMENCLLQRLGS